MNKKPKKSRKGDGASELPGMPDKDRCGTCAQNYLTAIDKVEGAKADLDEEREVFIKAMTDAKRKTISINGFVLSVKHKPAADTVSVKKANP